MNVSTRDRDWLAKTSEAVRLQGYAVVTDLLSPEFCAQARERMYAAKDKIDREIGPERVARSGELGVVRLPLKYEPFFAEFLGLPRVAWHSRRRARTHVDPAHAKWTDFTVGVAGRTRRLPKDVSPRLSALHERLPGVDQRALRNRRVHRGNRRDACRPGVTSLRRPAVGRISRGDRGPGDLPAGSALVFDAMLYHAAGRNTSGRDPRRHQSPVHARVLQAANRLRARPRRRRRRGVAATHAADPGMVHTGGYEPRRVLRSCREAPLSFQARAPRSVATSRCSATNCRSAIE